MSTHEEWWDAVTATAVLGSGRRGLPEPPAGLPVRTGVPAETALLDAAALGGALVRAGRPLATDAAPETAGPDRRPVAPAAAVQLLELVLTQTPGGRALRDAALEHWLNRANAAGRRVPARLLPRLLDHVLTRSDLHRAALDAADARGAWLVANRAKWRPLARPAAAATAGDTDADEWARQPTAARAEALARLRATDPAGARERLESVWATEKAADRAVLLATLATGLTTDDDAFLERVLDDRSAVVRTAAQDLLDGLPGSARGARLAALLRPLIGVSGRLRKHVDVELPTDPDAAAERDGLDQGPKDRSRRGYWMERLAAGAPLEVWTGATGKDPAATWPMITDADARAGIVRAVLARHDVVWARAMAGDLLQADPLTVRSRAPLLAVLPPAEREAAVLRRLRAGGLPTNISDYVEAVPAPWSIDLSRAVLAHLAGREAAYNEMLAILALRLPPAILPEIQRLPDKVAKPRNRLVQHLSLVQAITEAFQ